MADKVLKTRIKHKYDTPANWAKATTFIPLEGEICIYDNGDGKEPQIKIGDGKTVVTALPFANTTYTAMNGATSSAAGSTGLVPAPAAGAQEKFLRGDGTWQDGPQETYIGNTAPTDSNVEIWIDTSVESAEMMRADAMKYTTFSIAVDNWTGIGPYTYTMAKAEITASMAILNFTLDAASQANQKAAINWETTDGSIILSTSVKPTGTIAGYLIATEVVEI